MWSSKSWLKPTKIDAEGAHEGSRYQSHQGPHSLWVGVIIVSISEEDKKEEPSLYVKTVTEHWVFLSPYFLLQENKALLSKLRLQLHCVFLDLALIELWTFWCLVTHRKELKKDYPMSL